MVSVLDRGLKWVFHYLFQDLFSLSKESGWGMGNRVGPSGLVRIWQPSIHVWFCCHIDLLHFKVFIFVFHVWFSFLFDPFRFKNFLLTLSLSLSYSFLGAQFSTSKPSKIRVYLKLCLVNLLDHKWTELSLLIILWEMLCP